MILPAFRRWEYSAGRLGRGPPADRGKLCVLPDPPESRRQGYRVFRRNEKSVFPIPYDLGNSPDRRHDHGQPRRHRREEGKRKPLPERRKGEDVHRAIEDRQIPTGAKKQDVVRYAFPENLLARFSSSRPLPIRMRDTSMPSRRSLAVASTRWRCPFCSSRRPTVPT